LYDHEGRDLQGPVDANPTNVVVAESFVQDSDENYVSGEDSDDFLAPGTDSYTNSGGSTAAQSLGPETGRRFPSGSRPTGFPAPTVPGSPAPSHVVPPASAGWARDTSPGELSLLDAEGCGSSAASSAA
jgi:hypothetical protein